jgi:hypothetical protein
MLSFNIFSKSPGLSAIYKLRFDIALQPICYTYWKLSAGGVTGVPTANIPPLPPT